MSEKVLQARGLSKAFGRGEGLVRAVDEVDLEVCTGETVAVMGPSGCGKSTLLHLLGGLERASGGEIVLAGNRLDQMGERALARLRRTAIGFVFQAFHLIDELTARENVELPALLAGQSPRAAKRQAVDLLERVGLADRATFLPAALSGGQRQRVAIARALSNDPLVVLADEPTGNLDSAATLEVLRLFDSLHDGRADAGHRHPRPARRGHRRPADLDAGRRLRRRDQDVRRHPRQPGRPRRAGGLSAMGRLLLICRLAVGDVRHRPTSAVLLVLAIVTAATTLTLGLALAGTSNQPYQQTRALTAGPDVVAEVEPDQGPGGVPVTGGPPADVAALTPLTHASGVVAHSGPYPLTSATLQVNGHEAGAQVEGRDQAAAPVDQPKLTQGRWVRPGEVVLERSFADDLGVGAGGQVTLNGRSFRVAGVAVTAASDLSDPQICFSGCDLTTSEKGNPGLVWMTRADAVSLATAAEPLSYTLNLKLADPADADAFANAYDNANPSSAAGLQSWESIAWGTAAWSGASSSSC